MTFPPEIEDNQNSDLVLARMKANDALTGIDTGPNSPMNMALAPVSIEVAELYRQIESMVWRNRLVGPQDEVAVGSDLDAVGQERGIYRLQGQTANGILRFTGPAGTFIPTGTIVTTLGPNLRRFATSHGVTIPTEGVIDVTAEAVNVGSSSNVPAGAIQLLEVPITRTTVTNPNPFIGGIDVETDDAYRARVLEFVRDPPNGSNPAQYRKWARDIPGVGGAVTLRPGEPDAGPPGTVDLYIVDNNMLPAPQALVDAVQNYIAPPRVIIAQDDTFTVTTPNGVTTGVTGITGALGTVIQMAYDAAAAGQVQHVLVAANLIQSGSWQARVSARVDDTTGTAVLVQVTAYNVTVGSICPTDPDAAPGGATQTWRAADLALEWTDLVVPFYWNGSDTIQIQVTRVQADTTTTLYVDSLAYRSRFSNFDREGLAPILDEVRVKPAIAVPVDVSASVHLDLGYVWADVVAALGAAITAYLRRIALVNVAAGSAVANDVIYGEVGATIQITPGVDYYDPTTLRVNGLTTNVSVAKRQVATPDVMTFTQI